MTSGEVNPTCMEACHQLTPLILTMTSMDTIRIISIKMHTILPRLCKQPILTLRTFISLLQDLFRREVEPEEELEVPEGVREEASVRVCQEEVDTWDKFLRLSLINKWVRWG